MSAGFDISALDRQLQESLLPTPVGGYDSAPYWREMDGILRQIKEEKADARKRVPAAVRDLYLRHMSKWHSEYSSGNPRASDLKHFIEHAEQLYQEGIYTDFFGNFGLERELRNIITKVALVALPLLAAGAGYWFGARSCP